MHVTRVGVLTMMAALGAAGCALDPLERRDADAAAFAPATGLTATLAGPEHIELRWKDNATREAGYFVEYTTSPDEAFVLLNAVPRDATLALHPDLAPDTRFIYRVTPFFGEASGIVSLMTGKAGMAMPASLTATAEPVATGSGDKSLRAGGQSADAAPAKLSAHLVSPTAVALEWQDRSIDEAGYLIEGTRGFEELRVFAYVPPNVMSYLVEDLPAETKCYFRVRAFYRGESSSTAEQKTGPRVANVRKP
jgi:hypothetical protein